MSHSPLIHLDNCVMPSQNLTLKAFTVAVSSQLVPQRVQYFVRVQAFNQVARQRLPTAREYCPQFHGSRHAVLFTTSS
jgi:hypothetical protein